MIYFINSDGSSSELSTAAVIGIVSAILAITVALYVLRGLGLYKLAKRYGLKYPILAWFPFTWFYTAGLLLGNVNLFGRRFEKFALTAFIIFTVSGVIFTGIQLVSYIPVAGYYLQGGTVYYSFSKNYITGCNAIFGTSAGYVGLVNFVDPYSDAFWKALDIAYYFVRIIRLISLFFTVILYSNFFRSFLPNHYFIATVFSVLFSSIGLFGLWAFAVRNNERVNYADYMRARYAAFYGINRGYGGTPTPPPSSEKKDEDPFENMGDGKASRGDEDPFGEFSDDKKD